MGINQMGSSFEGFRHSLKPKKSEEAGTSESEEFAGISNDGVELARSRAHEIAESLENEPAGTVYFLGGSSEQIRTKSSARAIGDELKTNGHDEIVVLTEEDIMSRGESVSAMVKKVAEIIEANADKKVFVDFPMMMKEFSMDHWMDAEGKGFSEFTKTILERNNNNETACVKDWLETQGKIGDIQGPVPAEVALRQLRGIERLRGFAQEQVPGHKLIVGAVGHSWNMDALAIYLANNGEVTPEGFEKVGGEMIKELQSAKVEIDEEGRAKLMYKGKEYEVNLDQAI